MGEGMGEGAMTPTERIDAIRAHVAAARRSKVLREAHDVTPSERGLLRSGNDWLEDLTGLDLDGNGNFGTEHRGRPVSQLPQPTTTWTTTTRTPVPSTRRSYGEAFTTRTAELAGSVTRALGGSGSASRDAGAHGGGWEMVGDDPPPPEPRSTAWRFSRYSPTGKGVPIIASPTAYMV